MAAFLAVPVRGEEVFVCGWDEVFVLQLDGDSGKKIWRWRATDQPQLPKDFRGLFGTTDECKPVEGGRKVLISSSGGGLAFVERESGRLLWYGAVGNAHSIELLPGNRVAAAGSTHQEGNRVVVFDLAKPDEPLYSAALYSGHGVIWDQERELLWALGFDRLIAYRLIDWETSAPALSQAAAFILPDSGGHDLYPDPGTEDLIVTTNNHVFLFNRDQRKFRLHPELGDKKGVKSVSVQPASGRLIYIQAEGQNWWSSQIRFLNPGKSLPLPGERIYKARFSHR
jgi:hypothetical protein